MSPTVSVVVPTSGRADFRHASLTAVAHQTRLPEEVLVSEDGVDHATRAVVEHFRASLPLEHISSETRLGQLGNRNRAFSLATCEFVAMLDDDDEWEPRFLERACMELARHPNCAFCAADHHLIAADGQLLVAETDSYAAQFGRSRFETGVHDDVLTRELRYHCYSLNSAVFRRTALEEIGFFPTDSETTPDLGLFLELGACGRPCMYLAERLGRYRAHSGQTSRVGRVAFSEGLVATLRGFSRRHVLRPADYALLAASYRAAVIELAVAHAHARHRTAALRTLTRYPELGWGAAPVWRIGVLATLLMGARKRRDNPHSTS